MDDALVLPQKVQDRINEIVLILVLMDDALVLDTTSAVNLSVSPVLILVLMDDALVQGNS